MTYISMPYCSHCKRWEDEVPLIRNAKNQSKYKTIQYHYCRECMLERTKSYYRRHRKSCYNNVVRSQKRYPGKQAARSRLNYAVRLGNITRPEACEDCGQTEKRICGHHNSFGKELDISWLCDACIQKRLHINT